MASADERELVEAVIERLRIEGMPAGSWLLDITVARQALTDAAGHVDELLARLQDAIVEGHRNV